MLEFFQLVIIPIIIGLMVGLSQLVYIVEVKMYSN